MLVGQQKLGYEKKIRDYGLNIFGMYGKREKLSHGDMINNNKKDLAINEHGLPCPLTKNYSSGCVNYINKMHKRTLRILQDAGYFKWNIKNDDMICGYYRCHVDITWGDGMPTWLTEFFRERQKISQYIII